MAESLDSIHEQLTEISGALGHVGGITEGIADDVKRINGRISHVDNRLEQHVFDDGVMFRRVFARLSFWRGGLYVLVLAATLAAGFFSGVGVR